MKTEICITTVTTDGQTTTLISVLKVCPHCGRIISSVHVCVT